MKNHEMILNLLPSELLALSLFLFLILIVQIAACLILFGAYRRVRAGESIGVGLVGRAGWLFLLVEVIGVLCVLDAVLIEPFDLETTKTTIQSAKLNNLSAPIRIVHISDIHSDPFVRVEERLPFEIARAKPDLIVFTGDACNSEKSLPIFRKCITRIASIAPTFVVYGNHDSRRGKRLNLFGGTGAITLFCETRSIVVKNAHLTISGVPVDGEACMPELLKLLSPDTYNVFLYHYPAQAEMVAKYNVDLFCAGHVHGGQVRLPWYGALVTRSETGKRFEYGKYVIGNMNLYVSRGIGMVGDFVPRVRFMCKPEVALLELVGEHTR